MLTWWQVWYPRARPPIEKTATKSYLHSWFRNGIQCSYQWEENKAIISWREREAMREHIPAPLEEMMRKVPVNQCTKSSPTLEDSLSNALPLFTLHQFFYCWDNAAKRQQNIVAQSMALFCCQNILFTSAGIPWTPNSAFLKHEVLPKYCNILIISAFSLIQKWNLILLWEIAVLLKFQSHGKCAHLVTQYDFWFSDIISPFISSTI